MRARASDKDSQQGHVLGGQRTHAPRMDREKTGRKERYPRWQGYPHCPPTSSSEGGTSRVREHPLATLHVCQWSTTKQPCIQGSLCAEHVLHIILKTNPGGPHTPSLQPILGDPTPHIYN